jgi:hypothetical protein
VRARNQDDGGVQDSAAVFVDRVRVNGQFGQVRHALFAVSAG